VSWNRQPARCYLRDIQRAGPAQVRGASSRHKDVSVKGAAGGFCRRSMCCDGHIREITAWPGDRIQCLSIQVGEQITCCAADSRLAR